MIVCERSVSYVNLSGEKSTSIHKCGTCNEDVTVGELVMKQAKERGDDDPKFICRRNILIARLMY